MKVPLLTETNASRGAQMGRPNILPVDDKAYRFVLCRLVFFDGDYDIEGAYWGSPETVWRAVTLEAHPWRPNWDVSTQQDDGRYLEVFVRAGTYQEAVDAVLMVVPNATFYPEKPCYPDVERAIQYLRDNSYRGIPKCDDASKHFRSMVPILEQLDEFTVAYIEAALWTEEEQLNDARRDLVEKSWKTEELVSMADLATETLEKMVKDCRSFQEYNDLTDYPLKNAGHDFWLTRCGHGCGYWEVDYGTEAQCEKLTKSARSYGNCDLYLGDDNYIYI